MRRVLVAVALVTATLGLGFASSDGVLFTWIGFINNALNPLGLGLLYVNAIAPLGTALVAFLVAVVVLAGGLLAAFYVLRVLRQAFRSVPAAGALRPVPRTLEWTAFALAAASVLLGLRGVDLLALLAAGGAS